MDLPFKLQPKQRLLKNQIDHGRATYVGYGGARGGAKSYAIDDLALGYGLGFHCFSLVFRRYYNELLDNHINPIFSRFPKLRKYYNSSDKILYHPKSRVPIIRFGYGETEDDIKKFQGPSYPLIFVDEATQSTKEVIEFLKTSNRDPEMRLPFAAKMILTANPGGPGHVYYKRVFIDRTYINNEDPEDYYFIQSHVWDNVYWSLKELFNQGYTIDDYHYGWTENQRIAFTLRYSDYAKILAGLPKDMKLAFLYGDWDVFAGMFFKGFEPRKEVIQPFRIPHFWPLIGSLDPGFSAPLSFGLQTKDEDGRIYRVGTYYNIDTIPNHAAAVRKFLKHPDSPVFPYTNGRMPDSVVAGRDAFSKLDKNSLAPNEETIFNHFQQRAGIALQKGNDGTGSRITNWWGWKSLFPNRFFLFDKLNDKLLEQMTSTESDETVVEDIRGRGNDPKVEDHALDDCKLGVAALRTPGEEDKDDQPDFIKKLNNETKKTFERDFMAV